MAAKEKRLQVRVTERQFDDVQEAARKYEMNPAEYCRMAIFDRIRRDKRERFQGLLRARLPEDDQ